MVSRRVSVTYRPVLAAFVTLLCLVLVGAAFAEPKTYRPSARDGAATGARINDNASAAAVRAPDPPRTSASPSWSGGFRTGPGTESARPTAAHRPPENSRGAVMFGIRRPPETTREPLAASAAVERPGYIPRERVTTDRPEPRTVAVSAGSYRRANSDYVAPRPTDGAVSTSAGSVRRAEKSAGELRQPDSRSVTGGAVGVRPPQSGTRTNYRPVNRVETPSAERPVEYRPPTEIIEQRDSRIERSPAPGHGSYAVVDRVESGRGVRSEQSTYRPDAEILTSGSTGKSYVPASGSSTRSSGDYRGSSDAARQEPMRFAPKPYKPDPVRPRYVPVSPPKSYRPPTYVRGYYYYPTVYYARPCYYPYWTFGFYAGFSVRSVYFYYGYFPYITVTRVIEAPYPRVIYVETPIYVRTGYYLENRSSRELDDTLADIRSAWIAGRFDLIQRHVRSGQRIAVLLDGEYDYSIDADDYLRMTRDAIERMETVSFIWEWVRQRSDGGVTAFAAHTYYDSSGRERTVYVSYTLHRTGSRYYITEVGSSLRPLY